ncbi:hypothetical protein Goklo_016698 [Gossypium klotzschianum]|uniref:Uncharacterized protein n=1 Tax=Gossypium klotzschianum TaxID=34286 RepID=A0A7J8UFC8_9ROSI|nr:hypothetical protein [Gossypium klotzschianum]
MPTTFILEALAKPRELGVPTVHVDDNDDNDSGEHLRDNTSRDVVANDVSNIAGSTLAAPKMITPNQIPSWLSM